MQEVPLVFFAIGCVPNTRLEGQEEAEKKREEKKRMAKKKGGLFSSSLRSGEELAVMGKKEEIHGQQMMRWETQNKREKRNVG